LRLQIRRLDRTGHRRMKLRHPPTVQQVRNQGCNEHRLARTAQPRDAKADHCVANGGMCRD